MDTISDFLIDLLGDSPTLMMSILVFLAGGTLAFGVMGLIRIRSSVKKRASEALSDAPSRRAKQENSLRTNSVKSVQKLIDYTAKYYSTTDVGNTKLLQTKLVQAGFLNPRAAGFYFVARAMLGFAFMLVAFISTPILMPETPVTTQWMLIGLATVIGYFGPSFYLSRRIAKRQVEHRTGFPDFMDLMVVCAEAGLSMEAALDRVGRELAESYRSLSANIHMATLEIRAGRTLSEALEHLGDRLGLEEARSFATLLQQSAELGSSLVDALRVYSDDMRHQRLSRAEEKAYALPSKLAIPLILCIFPVLVIAVLLPAYIRVKYTIY
jgi:tight adherence protein C